MLLLIDNYDSFAYNLARYFVRLGCEIRVIRNDATTAAEIEQWAPKAIVLSPGPCTPQEAGCCVDLVRTLSSRTPMLGVCLGHQAIIAAFGGRIVRCPPMHGMTSQVFHDQRGVYRGLPTPLSVCRYHSLAADRETLPEVLDVTGETGDGLVMSVGHRDHPVIGLQFHPESILTEHGYELLDNFLRMAGIPGDQRPPCDTDELAAREVRPDQLPRRPVTF